VLVGDTKDRSIKRYDRTGTLLNVIGKENHVRGFLIPNGALDFSVDPAGVIHAANPGRHCVERYSADGRLQERVGHFDGVKPDGYGGCCNPTNVVVARGRTYVTEKAAPRAKVLDREGKLLAVIASKELDPSCRNSDIAVDSLGRVYVVDTVRLEALVFEEAS
jgi:sugar lactone lactonase YvrE